jgi:AraC family transcriptional regulator, transcriptional activator of pobA
MMVPSEYTLLHPQHGKLAFSLKYFEGNRHFQQVQRHNYYSVIWVQEGRGVLNSDFFENCFSAGTMMFFSPYQPFKLTSSDDVKGVAIRFHPDFYCIYKHNKEVSCNGILFNNLYQPPFIQIPGKDIPMFAHLLLQIQEGIQSTEVGQYELLISYLKIVLIQATRIKVNQHPQVKEDFTPGEEPFILQTLKEKIEENFKIRHAPGDYAEMLHITPKALAKLTKTHFKKTLTNLIAERIVIEAKRELYLTTKSVKEIAYDLGFNDEYYFSRFFKNNTTISPATYRETVGSGKGEILSA